MVKLYTNNSTSNNLDQLLLKQGKNGIIIAPSIALPMKYFLFLEKNINKYLAYIVMMEYASFIITLGETHWSHP